MRQNRSSASATSLLGCCTLLLVVLNQFHKCDAFYGSEGGRPVFDVPILPALIPFSAFIFVRFGEQVVPFQAKKLNVEYDYIVGEYCATEVFSRKDIPSKIGGITDTTKTTRIDEKHSKRAKTAVCSTGAHPLA